MSTTSSVAGSLSAKANGTMAKRDSRVNQRILGWARDFENGLGKVLQERLHGELFNSYSQSRSLLSAEALDKASPNNWLDDNIWLKKAYHEWRAPLIVHSNWWLSFRNDSNIPLDIQVDPSKDEIPGTGITRWQVRRAAWLTHRSLEFKGRLERCNLTRSSSRSC